MNPTSATSDPHRHRRIIKGQNEPECLIYGRAYKFGPSSSKHPLRDHVTGGTNLVVNSRVGKKNQPLKLNTSFSACTQISNFQQ